MSEQLPKISVITPSYNQGEFLEETIQSVIQQDYPNLEYIVIDGGSKDHSVEVIRRYASRIDYWVSEKDSGQSEAINKGMARASGEIVTWLNSDDFFEPGTLHKVAAYFAKAPQVAVVHGKNINFGEGFKKRVCGADPASLPYSYLGGLPFAQPSSFFRRSILNEFGLLGENFHYGMDYDFFVYVALNYEMLRVDDIFSHYRLHNSSKSVQGNIHFSHDYSRIFSKVLRSFDFTRDIIGQMRELGLYEEGQDSYRVSKSFSPGFLQQSLWYHLRFQLGFLYEAMELKQCYAITRFLRQQAPAFYAQHPEFEAIRRRSRWLTKPLMQLLRKLKRRIA